MTTRANEFKVVLLGEGRVGKTSLLIRFVNKRFSDKEQATIQATPFSPQPLLLGAQKVSLSLWDTAGQERFHSLGPIYYRDAAAALLVFDITDVDSFERVKAWVKELRQMVGPNIVLTIAANKCDLEKERSVPENVIASYAQDIGANFFNTSAKTGAGLESAFLDIATKCLELQQARLAREASVSSSLGRGAARRRHAGITIADESVALPPTKQPTCC